MPPPSLRRSPSRESRARHNKGRSLESGLSFKDKDDDLALFKEVQSKEQDIFLLHSMEDLEDILSTNLKPLGITIPARGESSDLLTVEDDKNDYEWLLTPPDTPLFPSLDDEKIPANLVHNGRPRNRRTSVSGSPTMEKAYASRGSASPQRLSPSPRSSVNSAFQSRGRPSSAPRSSPTPSSRHSTPTRRFSAPSVKPSTPPCRSSSPTPRRLSTGSGAGVRGASPVSSSRGSSSSPKIRAWQTNIPGFSLEVPPNLCTSLADRPSSFVRGSSPASRNRRNCLSVVSSTVRRQSMSPTSTRRIGSPHSRERDRFNSHSKGSVGSSSYDDTDSFLSGSGGLSSNRAVPFSKKPSKVITPSSAPKRSFDTAIRHMDHRSPQNMFRPLLSSVPSTTFYGGKAASSHDTMASMNSSVTTSSNASSDQAAIGAPDTVRSEHNQYDVPSKSGKILSSDDLDGEIFSFDRMDEFHGGAPEIHDQSPEIQLGEYHEASAFEPKPDGLNYLHPAVNSGRGHAQAQNHIGELLCSKCGCIYNVTELVEDEVNFCPECKENEEITLNSISFSRLDVPHNTPGPKTNILEEVGSSNESVLYPAAPESSDVMKLHLSSDVQVMAVPDPSTAENHGLSKFNDLTPSKIDIAEGAGISVLLLKRSGSSNGAVIQGRGFAASSVSYDVRSYARESTMSIRSSIGHDSASTFSSTDMSSSHAEMPMQRQLSGSRSENSLKSESIGPYTQNSSHISQGLGLAAIVQGENLNAHAGCEHPAAIDEPETSFEPAGDLENIQRLDKGNDTPALKLQIDVSGNRSEDSPFPLLTVDDQQNLAAIDVHLLKEEEYSNPEESSLKDETPNNAVDQIEVLEAPHNDMSEISEIENDDCHSVGPKGDVVSNDALQEPSHLLHEPSHLLHEHKDVSGSRSKRNELEVAPSILEESKVTVEDQEGTGTRSLTLDEAADTILFCSSIVHSLAYDAATIAINKENENMNPLEPLRPALTIKDRPISDTTNPHFRSIRKRTPKADKGRQRQEEVKTDLHYNKMEAGDDNKPAEPSIRSVGLPHNMESSKPPKLESKCNCTIM